MADEGQTNTHVLETSEGPVINVQDISEAHMSTPRITINNPPSPSFVEFDNLFSSPAPYAPFSPPFYVQFVIQKPTTPLSLIRGLSTQLTFD